MREKFRDLTYSNRFTILEWVLIVGTPLIPLFFVLPYRINLFLAWEGAYRISQGEIPYRDFGTPVGYVFWILPAIFFKLFGPYVITLLKVQVLTNIIGNYSFTRIFKHLGLETGGRIIALTVFILSYTLFNFWPWYNHLVFILQMLSVQFILQSFSQISVKHKYGSVAVAALFAALSFMTKQDTGSLTFVIGITLLVMNGILEKSIKSIFFYILSYILCLSALILPFIQYEFTYWFNVGQEPHFSRLTLFDFLDEFFGASHWIKFYLLVIILILIIQLKETPLKALNRNQINTFILILFILFQASVIQVTSYTPIDGNIYFHSFVVGLIVLQLQRNLNFSRISVLAIGFALISVWWSKTFWISFIRPKVKTVFSEQSKSKNNVISRKTYILSKDSLNMDRSVWATSDIKTFKRIKLPIETISGIKQLKELPLVKSNQNNLKVLNMSELTQLIVELPYDTEKGAAYPLWYHQGVSFFDRESSNFCTKIQNKAYDIILFQDIPELNNFYPYAVRDCILKNYSLEFKFLAPRIPESSYVEVYVKK